MTTQTTQTTAAALHFFDNSIVAPTGRKVPGTDIHVGAIVSVSAGVGGAELVPGAVWQVVGWVDHADGIASPAVLCHSQTGPRGARHSWAGNTSASRPAIVADPKTVTVIA